MKKKNRYGWLLFVVSAVVVAGVALHHVTVPAFAGPSYEANAAEVQNATNFGNLTVSAGDLVLATFEG